MRQSARVSSRASARGSVAVQGHQLAQREGQPGCCPFQTESEMDAKARDLALLGALSLFCAIFAWAFERDVLGSVFFALGVVGILGATYRQWP